jgi:hypothetical protein
VRPGVCAARKHISLLGEQEYGPQHPITRKLASMHADAQALLREK